jgi:hypothetical protein
VEVWCGVMGGGSERRKGAIANVCDEYDEYFLLMW